MRRITKIYIHHSALPRDKGIDEIRELHIGRGFDDIGYHFVIDQSGKVWTGRPIDKEGANVKGDNKESIGICVCGNCDEKSPLKSQIEALEKLVLELCKKWGKLEILGHRDYSNSDTQCPGNYLYSILPELRNKANTLYYATKVRKL